MELLLKHSCAFMCDTPKTILYEYSKSITSPRFYGELLYTSYTKKKMKCRNRLIEYYEIHIKGADKPMKIDVNCVEIRQLG